MYANVCTRMCVWEYVQDECVYGNVCMMCVWEYVYENVCMRMCVWECVYANVCMRIGVSECVYDRMEGL